MHSVQSRHSLRLFRTSVVSGLALAGLLNCSSSEPVQTEPTPTGTTDAGPVGAGPTGAGGTGNTVTVTSGGSDTITTAVTGGGATTSTDAAAVTSTTGPLFLSGVGGSFIGNRDDGSTDACQGLAIEFAPEIPTVFILVDRSTSMWDNMFWDPLRTGVLEVVSRLHEDVRFGFGTFTGYAGGNTCPLDLEDVGIIDKNNYAAI